MPVPDEKATGWGREELRVGMFPSFQARRPPTMAEQQRNGEAAETNGGGGQRPKRPLMIGIAGGTSSGKSPVCEKIMERLGSEGQRRVVHLTQEDFYKVPSLFWPMFAARSNA